MKALWIFILALTALSAWTAHAEVLQRSPHFKLGELTPEQREHLLKLFKQMQRNCDDEPQREVPMSSLRNSAILAMNGNRNLSAEEAVSKLIDLPEIASALQVKSELNVSTQTAHAILEERRAIHTQARIQNAGGSHQAPLYAPCLKRFKRFKHLDKRPYFENREQLKKYDDDTMS